MKLLMAKNYYYFIHLGFKALGLNAIRNLESCNHSICDYMRLFFICNCFLPFLQLVTILLNFGVIFATMIY